MAVDLNPIDPSTDQAVMERARQLSNELQNSSQQQEASTEVAQKLEIEFNKQVEYFGNLGTKYMRGPKN